MLINANIAPSEAWKLDFPEINIILDLETKIPSSDISLMINAERKINGITDKRYLIQ